jgi:hypothetical protein
MGGASGNVHNVKTRQSLDGARLSHEIPERGCTQQQQREKP